MHAARGFTLIEMIVVMVLISVSAATVFGYNFAQQENLRLKGAAREAYSFLRTSRSYAIMEGRDNVCTYVIDERRFVDNLGNISMELPEDVSMEMPEGFVRTMDVKTVDVARFHAQGTADPDVIVLASSEKRLLLTIDPVLGEVKVGDLELEGSR